VRDGSVLRLIKSWLRAPVVAEDQDGTRRVSPNLCGTPQGGVISPLLANLYLNPLDHGEVEGGPMNEFGEPNMGNPSVRFDEGRSESAEVTTAVGSIRLLSLCLLYLSMGDSRWSQ